MTTNQTFFDAIIGHFSTEIMEGCDNIATTLFQINRTSPKIPVSDLWTPLLVITASR